MYGIPACVHGSGRNFRKQDETVTDLFPMQSDIEIVELEGVPQSGDTTHKGFLPVRMAIWEEKGIREKQVYLPVVVNPDEEVYVPLEVICSHFGMTLHEVSSRIVEVEVNGGVLRFRNMRSQIEYEPVDSRYEHSVILPGQLAFRRYDDRWCVGLNDFLNAAGCFVFETEAKDTEAAETQKAEVGQGMTGIMYCRIPTQLDAFRQYFQQADDSYLFTMSDLGNSRGNQDIKLMQSEILGYLGDFWDTNVVAYTLLCWIPVKAAEDQALAYFKNAFFEKFLAYQLTCNEQISSHALQLMDQSAEPVSVIAKLAADKGRITGAKLAEALKKTGIRSDAVTGWLNRFGDKLGDYLSSNDFDADFLIVSHLLGYLCMLDQYSRGDDYEISAADTFLHAWKKEGSYLSGEMTEVISRELEHYREAAAGARFELALHYLEKNGVSLSKDVLALLGWGLSPEAAAVALVWKAGFEAVTWGAGSRAESYVAGYYGISYEIDAVREAVEAFQRILKDGQPSDSEWQELEYLTYHALKASYTVRDLILEGCSGIGENTAWQVVKNEQNAINREIEELCAQIRNPLADRGLLPDEMRQKMTEYRDFYPQVILNIAEISGEVLCAENGQPARNVVIGIYGDEEESLAVETTDQEGRFTLSFDLDDGDLFEDRPDIRDLTLYLYTENYAVTIVPVEVKSGHRYRVDGLHTGELGKESFLYLTGAKTQNGRVILDTHVVAMGEETYLYQPPSWMGNIDDIYCPMGEIYIDADITRVMLPQNFKISTVYGNQLQGMEWAGLMIDEVLGTDDMKTMMKQGLCTSEEINAYTQKYYEYNHEYPAYRMLSSNSRVKKLEPVYIIRS